MKISPSLIILFALVHPWVCYASKIACKSEAVSFDITDARDFATSEATEKLQIRFQPVLENIVDTYAKYGQFSLERESLLQKVTRSVFSTYRTTEQKMSRLREDGEERFYALVEISIQSERLLKAMDIYVLPKAGDNRRAHNRKVNQLQKVIEAEFEAANILSGDAEPAKPHRKR